MKCKECGFQNDLRLGSAKFCANCGSPLNKKKINYKHSKTNLKKKQLTHKKNVNTSASQSAFAIKKLWLGAAIILGAFLIYSIVEPDSSNSNSYLPDHRSKEEKSENPFIEAKVFEIASKFVCACGGCDEDSLDICKCDFAIEERQFIRDYLENSQSEEAIIEAVNKKYGGMKPS